MFRESTLTMGFPTAKGHSVALALLLATIFGCIVGFGLAKRHAVALVATGHLEAAFAA